MMDFEKAGGLIAAVVQDYETGEVLQVSWQNPEAFELTRKTGRMHYYSRSRAKLWMKGETSGHIQEVQEIRIDCDEDAAVYKVKQVGGACHTGYRSCFHRRLEPNGDLTLLEAKKLFDPAQVYAQ
ncbi:MAG TPA: phosphoribosyl-AMP cyclohydrolase [bacterium]|nr:phosphoribosyl-AMP cyclohydrolase [bacterium]